MEIALNFIQRYGGKSYLVILVLGTILFTAFQISGTSAGVYHRYLFGNSNADAALIFGEPRGIRSDEYVVSTAWTAAQDQQDFPRINPLYGLSGQTFLFYDAPVKDFTLLFKPQNWGFAFLPFNNAFAFKWWFRAALFLYAAYLIFLRISKHQVLFSILASLALFFSPHIQWWYSVTMMDIVAVNLLLFECLIRMVRFESKRELIIYTVLFCYLWIDLILLFYPPTQIIFGWLFVILAASFFLYERKQIQPKIKPLLFAFGSTMVTLGIFITIFVIKYKPMIEAVINTAYPGKRSVAGGGFNLVFLLGGFFNLQLLQSNVPIPPIFANNQSMASGFFMYGIFLLPIMILLGFWNYKKSRKINFGAAVLVILFILFTLWEMFGIPQPIASLLFVASVPPIRVLYALGILNMLLLVWYLYRFDFSDIHFFGRISIVLSIALALFYLGFGLFLRFNYPGFLASPYKIIGLPILIGLTFYFLLQKRGILFITLLVAFSLISTYRVNPLYKGLGELNSGKLANTIRAINETDQGHSRWIIYDSAVLNDFLPANGIHALSGTYYYPDLPLWQKFDPENKNSEVYNRYAHFLFRPNKNSDQAQFVLTYRDAASVYVSPCSAQLADLNVKYQVFPYPVKYPCLKQIEQINYPKLQLYIYETH